MSFFDVVCSQCPPSWGTLIERFGQNTPFEAVTVVEINDESNEWSGFMVFKDERFSPAEKDLPVQLKYFTPTAASGTLALNRARNHWSDLCSVFTRLMEADNA